MDRKKLIVFTAAGIVAAAALIAAIEWSMRCRTRQEQPACTVSQPAPDVSMADEEHAAPAADFEYNKRTGAKQFLR